ncbi:MAG: sulfatase-like hydrolase/transferase [Caldilineaceae bacterium]
MAAEGVRFDQCHAGIPGTPSRCSMMTGWYPHVRGHRTLWHMLRPDEPNLLRYLKQKGYTVHWYGKNDLPSPGSLPTAWTWPSRQGEVRPPTPAEDDPRYYSFLYEPYADAVEDHGDYANVQAGIDSCAASRKILFILYLPLTFPHCPYSSRSRGTIRSIPMTCRRCAPPIRPTDQTLSLIRQTRHLDQIDEAVLRKIQAVSCPLRTGYIDLAVGPLAQCAGRKRPGRGDRDLRLLGSRRLRRMTTVWWKSGPAPRKTSSPRRPSPASPAAHADTPSPNPWNLRRYGHHAGSGMGIEAQHTTSPSR